MPITILSIFEFLFMPKQNKLFEGKNIMCFPYSCTVLSMQMQKVMYTCKVLANLLHKGVENDEKIEKYPYW